MRITPADTLRIGSTVPVLTVCLLLTMTGIVSADDDRPNVVFVLSDNQSYHELGYHGNDVIETPRLDELASQGVDFTRFYTEPYCSPSRASLMTGRRAMKMRVYDTIGGVSMLPSSSTTMAELLRNAGYETGYFGKWHVGDSFPLGPSSQGFDTTFIHGGGGVGQLPDFYGNSLFDTTFIENGYFVSGRTVDTEGYNTDVLFDRSMKFVRQHPDEPFFCFISTPVTHKPWAAPEKYKKPYREKGMDETSAKLYGQITNLDENVGRLMNLLDEMNLEKETIVIFMSDQGMGRGVPDDDMKVRNDLRTVNSRGSDWSQHVAFTVRYPARVDGDRVERTLTSSVDIVPTLMEWCDLDHNQPEMLDGRSLVPILEDPDASWPDRTVIIQCPRGRKAKKWHNVSVKTQRWRLVDGKKLFDARHDPEQTENVADEHPGVVNQLKKQYETFWSKFDARRPPLVRPVLGASEHLEVRLTAMDWFKGDKPWRQGQLNRFQNGAWAVRVAREGRYRIELRRYPREAKKSHGAEHAKLQIGNVDLEQDANPDENSITFTSELPSGKTTFKSVLTGTNGKKFGAYFAYVTWLGP